MVRIEKQYAYNEKTRHWMGSVESWPRETSVFIVTVYVSLQLKQSIDNGQVGLGYTGERH